MAAGISIFTLLGSIMIDNDKANESISKTEGKAEGLAKKFGDGMKTAAKWGAAIGGAAIAGGTALFGMAEKASDAGDRVDKMSQKIGVSKEAFQSLDYVLGQNGADVDILQKGFQTLTGIMDKTADSTNKNKTALDTLGISVTDVNGKMKSQEEVFNESVKALMGMDEGVERSTLASELFGKKVASELVPMLNAGVESYEELTQRAHDLGFVMSDEAVAAGAAFNDSMDDVKKALGGVMTRIGIEVMPVFQTMLNWILDHMPEIQEVIRIVFEAIGKFVGVVVDIFTNFLIPAFQSIYDWTKKNWPTIQTVIKGVFDGIKTVWDTVLKPTLDILWDLFKKIVEWVAANWPTISNVFSTVFNIIKAVWDNVLKPTLDFFWGLIKNIVDWVVGNWPTIQQNFENVFNAIKAVWDNVLKPVLDFFLEALKGIIQFVADKFDTMKETVVNVMDNMATAVDKVKESFEWLSDAIGKAWDWLTKWNDTDMEDKESNVTINETTVTSTVKAEEASNASSGGGTRGSDNKFKVDGSHALGLAYVPFNNYKANLHEGEGILTKQENREYKNSKSGVNINNLNITIPAKDILQFKNVTDFFNNIGQVAKAGVVNG